MEIKLALGIATIIFSCAGGFSFVIMTLGWAQKYFPGDKDILMVREKNETYKLKLAEQCQKDAHERHLPSS